MIEHPVGQLWSWAEKYLASLFSKIAELNPSLFQNVILGILAIFVPVGVAVFSFYFQKRAEGNIEANLELFVLLSKVLKAKQLVFLFVLLLVLFSLSPAFLFIHAISLVVFFCFIIWLFVEPFHNIWRWFLENPDDFAIQYLKKRNINDSRNLLLTWQSLWVGSDDSKYANKEQECTNIFVDHVNKAFSKKKFECAVELVKIYLKYIDHRNLDLIERIIFPIALEWSEKLWDARVERPPRSQRIQRYEKIVAFFNQMPLPEKYCSRIIGIVGKKFLSEDSFYDYACFIDNTFLPQIEQLLSSKKNSYLYIPIITLKKRENHFEKRLQEMQIHKSKHVNSYRDYYCSVYASFGRVLLEHGDPQNGLYGVNGIFPNEWKITPKNIQKNWISGVIFCVFGSWMEGKYIGNSSPPVSDLRIGEVVAGLFPGTDAGLFRTFLMVYFSGNIWLALKKGWYWPKSKSESWWVGNINEEEQHQCKTEEWRAQENYTCKLITEVFGWPLLTKDDLLLEEMQNTGENLLKGEREQQASKAKLKKLSNMREETKAIQDNQLDEYQKENKKLILYLIEVLERYFTPSPP